jgi:hypothetical protein
MKSYEPLKPDSLYWPKAGDEGTEVEVVWEETEPGRFGDLLVVRTDTGIRKVTESARIAAVRSKMKLGARYRFSFRGMVKLKNGQMVESGDDGGPRAARRRSEKIYSNFSTPFSQLCPAPSMLRRPGSMDRATNACWDGQKSRWPQGPAGGVIGGAGPVGGDF